MIDMTFETREKLIRKESYEDGLEDGKNLGITQGKESVIFELIQKGSITPKEGSEVLEITEEELLDIMKNAGYSISKLLLK